MHLRRHQVIIWPRSLFRSLLIILLFQFCEFWPNINRRDASSICSSVLKYRVFKKVAPPTIFWNIFTPVKYFCVKFCKFVGSREWHGVRCLTPLPPRKIYSCTRRQPVLAPFASFCPHPRPVTVLFVPIHTPLPQSCANKNTPFTGVEKTMDIFWHFVRMFSDFIWIYVNSFYFLHFVRNVTVLLIFNIAAFT